MQSIKYLDAGAGQAVIFIHAFPLNAEMWRPQLDGVPQGWRFIAPDLRGFGASGLDREADLTVDDYARDVVSLMDALALETAVIAGLSLGGYISFALFRLAPSRCRGFILADTKAPADTPDGRRARQALLEVLHTKGVAAVADELAPKLLGETTRREHPQVMAELRRLVQMNSVPGIASAIHALMYRPDSTPDLARIAVPTLVIVGQEDTITPISEAEALHRDIRGSRLDILARVGHLSNLEAPDEFSAAAVNFLQRAF